MPDAERPTRIVDAEMSVSTMTVQIVRYFVPAPTAAVLCDDQFYQLDMCLTPRPIISRCCYRKHWGPLRFERLGDIFLVPPGEELVVKGGSVQQYSLLCQIDPDAIDGLIGEHLVWDERKLAAMLDITSAQVRALLLRIADEVRDPGIASARMLELLAGQLAIALGRFQMENSAPSAKGGLAGWRLRRIDERLNKGPLMPSLSELADICSISVRHLTRGFRTSRGCSIHEYVLRSGMETAKRMLVEGEKIDTIASELGFSSPSGFTFAFRRSVGISPREFRQRQTRGLAKASGLSASTG